MDLLENGTIGGGAVQDLGDDGGDSKLEHLLPALFLLGHDGEALGAASHNILN